MPNLSKSQKAKNKQYNQYTALKKKVAELGEVGEKFIEQADKIKGVEKKTEFLIEATRRLRKSIEIQKKYKEEPVSIETFLFSEEYLGLGRYEEGVNEGGMYPNIEKTIKEIVEGDYIEVVLTGAIGTSKTTISIYVLAYELYLLSILRNPQKELGLFGSDEIVFIFQSLNSTQAKTVSYSRFKELITNSKYFREKFPYDKRVESELQFPSRIYVRPVSGNSTAAIGQNVLACMLDECFIAGTKIQTEYGVKNIEDIIVGDKVISINERGEKIVDTVVDSRCTGEKETFCLELDDGQTLTGTYNHPIATERGWVPLGELSQGDYIYASAERSRSLCSLEREDVCSPQGKEEKAENRKAEGSNVRCNESVYANRKRESSDRENGSRYKAENLGPRSEETITRKCNKKPHSLCPINGESGAGTENVSGYEQHGIYEGEEGTIERFKVCAGSQTYAHPRGERESRSIPQGEQTLYSHLRKNVRVSNKSSSIRGLHGEVQIPDEERCQIQIQVKVRGTGSKDTRFTREYSEFPIRASSYPLSGGRGNKKYNTGFSSSYGRGGFFTGDKEQLQYKSGQSEATSYGEVCPKKWNGVCSMDRRRVVQVTTSGKRRVFNFETRDTHTYIANNIVVHNCNFMQVVERSKNSREKGTYDQAWENYRSLVRRRKSRFMRGGKVPGKFMLASSTRYPGEFTDVKKDEAKKDESIYIYDKREWEVKPAERFTGEWFDLFIGDLSRRPRILKVGERVTKEDEHLVMKIPMEFKSDFESDMTTAIRDIAGVSTLALEPYIINVDKVFSCFGTYNSILSSEETNFLSKKVSIYPRRIKRKDQNRFVHIDLGITNDHAGITCGYVSGFRNIERAEDCIETLPVVCLDFILDIEPPPNGEIEIEKIRSFIYKLEACGLPVKWITFDTYQSTDSLQILKKRGYRVGIQSMDKTTVPYDLTKSAFMDQRVLSPTHDKAYTELISLERDVRRGKIDHGPHGSKDVSDSIAGVVYGLSTRKEIWLNHGIPLYHIPESIYTSGNDYKNSVDNYGGAQ